MKSKAVKPTLFSIVLIDMENQKRSFWSRLNSWYKAAYDDYKLPIHLIGFALVIFIIWLLDPTK